MVSRTRTRRNSDGDEDAETVVEMEESEKTGEVKSDMSYDSKFIIAQGSSLAGKNLYFLRHPKSLSAALYVISNDSVEEVLRIDQPCRSFLYGESVISNGSFTVFSPIHPLFLVVPYILKNARVWFLFCFLFFHPTENSKMQNL
ncbi:hypothetical protein AB6A40_006301 [Gnathostoma spinigerum]|uniref:Uncharacterized protein n=1 Tax=Gnathostoma spinigerum TaxID=75299 RepID=A0ABD6ESE0_9BILA